MLAEGGVHAGPLSRYPRRVQWEPVALALVGAALVAARLGWLVMVNINGSVFVNVLRKLLTAGNRDRAIKLTYAAPRAHLARATRAVLEASRDLSPTDGESLVRESLSQTLSGALATEQRHLRRTGWVALVGALAAAGAAFLAFSGQESPPGAVTGLVLGATAGALLCWHRSNRMTAELRRHSTELVPDVTAYVMRAK